MGGAAGSAGSSPRATSSTCTTSCRVGWAEPTVRWAPVAAPALLVVYCEDAQATAAELDLLPVQEGANVVLLRAFDPVAWERSRIVDDVACCAPSQVAVDCLTGNGRMPAEGQELLRWMAQDESRWRAPSLQQAAAEPGTG